MHWDYHGTDGTGSDQALVLLPGKAGSGGVAERGGDFTLYTFSKAISPLEWGAAASNVGQNDERQKIKQTPQKQEKLNKTPNNETKNN